MLRVSVILNALNAVYLTLLYVLTRLCIVYEKIIKKNEAERHHLVQQTNDWVKTHAQTKEEYENKQLEMEALYRVQIHEKDIQLNKQKSENLALAKKLAEAEECFSKFVAETMVLGPLNVGNQPHGASFHQNTLNAGSSNEIPAGLTPGHCNIVNPAGDGNIKGSTASPNCPDRRLMPTKIPRIVRQPSGVHNIVKLADDENVKGSTASPNCPGRQIMPTKIPRIVRQPSGVHNIVKLADDENVKGSTASQTSPDRKVTPTKILRIVRQPSGDENSVHIAEGDLASIDGIDLLNSSEVAGSRLDSGIELDKAEEQEENIIDLFNTSEAVFRVQNNGVTTFKVRAVKLASLAPYEIENKSGEHTSGNGSDDNSKIGLAETSESPQAINESAVNEENAALLLESPVVYAADGDLEPIDGIDHSKSSEVAGSRLDSGIELDKAEEQEENIVDLFNTSEAVVSVHNNGFTFKARAVELASLAPYEVENKSGEHTSGNGSDDNSKIGLAETSIQRESFVLNVEAPEFTPASVTLSPTGFETESGELASDSDNGSKADSAEKCVQWEHYMLNIDAAEFKPASLIPSSTISSEPNFGAHVSEDDVDDNSLRMNSAQQASNVLNVNAAEFTPASLIVIDDNDLKETTVQGASNVLNVNAAEFIPASLIVNDDNDSKETTVQRASNVLNVNAPDFIPASLTDIDDIDLKVGLLETTVQRASYVLNVNAPEFTPALSVEPGRRTLNIDAPEFKPASFRASPPRDCI